VSTAILLRKGKQDIRVDDGGFDAKPLRNDLLNIFKIYSPYLNRGFLTNPSQEIFFK